MAKLPADLFSFVVPYNPLRYAARLVISFALDGDIENGFLGLAAILKAH